MKSVKSLLSRVDDLPRCWRTALFAALILAMTGVQWLQLDLSCGTMIIQVLTRNVGYHFINLAFVFVIDLMFLLLSRRWYIAYILGSVFFCVWGVANHYVWLFSGDVLTVSALRSTLTAMNVLSGYHLPLDFQVIVCLLGLLFNIALCFLLRRLSPRPIPWRGMRTPAACLAAIVVLSSVWLSHSELLATWTTRVDVEERGYPIYFVQQALTSRHQILQPGGYDEAAVAAMADAVAPTAAELPDTLPDIILILNESFYFLDDYLDLDTDVPYHDNWDDLTNSIRGRAVVPAIGGGTNKTEFELLLSDSMYLLASQAPFNSLDLSGSNNIVRYLKSLGYSTYAMHDASDANYSRGRAFPALGFDDSIFRPSFPKVKYGQRSTTDKTDYQVLFRRYEQRGDGPRFLYLLTLQNHGGFEQNDDSFDTVHTGRDLGDMTDDVNEYLTSIKMSDGAIKSLTNYFNKVDRPVLICMLGDHSPSFIYQLSSDLDLSAEETDVLLRSTPFFIWANDAFGPIEEKDDMLVSVPDLVPMVLDMAGIPLSPYYRTILDISERIPARLSTGMYRTADGEYGTFSQDDANYELLAPYYFMEYNSFQKPAERYQVLFDPALK